MRPPSRFNIAGARIVRTLVKAIFPASASSLNLLTHEYLQRRLAEKDMRAAQHWASDNFEASEELIPIREASLMIQQVCLRRGGAQYWSWAEDGGIYLYRYSDEQPFARVSVGELSRVISVWEHSAVPV